MYDVSPQVLASVLFSGAGAAGAAGAAAASNSGDHLPEVLAATGIADGRLAWLLAAAALMLMLGIWARLRVRGMRVVAGVDRSFDPQRALTEFVAERAERSDR